jgi:hypothetical protein
MGVRRHRIATSIKVLNIHVHVSNAGVDKQTNFQALVLFLGSLALYRTGEIADYSNTFHQIQLALFKKINIYLHTI